MRVRRLGPGDAAEALRASPLFDEPPSANAVRAYLEDDRNVFLIAVEGADTVGFLRGTALGQVKSERRQMFLYEIAVAERSRRRGVARELVEWLLGYCRKNGFAEVFVLTDPANTAAVNLYRSTGGVTETAADRMFVYRL